MKLVRQLLIATLFSASNAIAAPSFFAFENGVRFGSTEERIKVLKELGYDGIGSARPKDIPARLKLYDEAELRIFSLYVGGKLGADGHTYDPAISEAIRQLKGRKTVIELFVQGGSGNTDEQAVAFVRDIADQAKASGLRVVLYPHAGFYIDALDNAVRIAKKCERDNVGVMFNLCHFLKVEPQSDLKETLVKAEPYLWQASTCGADVDGKNWGALIQTLERGSFDQAAFLKLLHELKFDGAIGLQCYAIKGDARENLKRSIDAWKKLNK